MRNSTARRSSDAEAPLSRLEMGSITRDSPLHRQRPQSLRNRPTDNPRLAELNTRKQPTTEKQQVPEPTTVSQFFVVFALHICKKYLLFNPGFKAPVYFIAVFLGSALGDLIRPSRKLYLSKPGNFVSEWFVELAHIWTFSFLSAFVACTSYVYGGGKMRQVWRNLCRVLFGLGIAFSIEHVFSLVESMSGFCSNEDIHRREICSKEGHRWLAFDTSEDAFFLVFFPLIIMEEATSFAGWEALKFPLRNNPMEVFLSPEQTTKNVAFMKENYVRFSGTVKLLFLSMTLLCVIWDVMLAMTAFFYQSLPQKLFGSVVAVVVWFIMYRVWFPSAWPFLPGRGILRRLPKKAIR